MNDSIAKAVPLSPREREVMLYTAIGLTAEQIGEKLFIETSTAMSHRKNSYVKLGVFAGAVEATAFLLITDLEFFNKVREAILDGRDKPIRHNHGGIQPGGFY